MMKQKLPLHKQAELYLRNLIEQDEYKEGKMLPNEIELSEQLKMSRNTLRQAINTLVSEGLLIRKRGIGTQVAEKNIASEATNWLSFSQEMALLGLEIETGDPILIRKRAVSDKNGLPIEYNIGWYRADSFTYKIESVRNITNKE